MSTGPPGEGAFLWPVRLAPGVGRGNLLTLYYACFVTIAFVSLLNFLQPYLLIENLHVPKDQQGTLTGQLGFIAELTIICLGLLVGAVSDRVGRRLPFTLGLLLMGAGYAGLGTVASVPEMFALRLVVATGACLAGVMLIAVQTDYPDDACRGKLLGLTALITALGVTVAVVLGGRLPALYEARGVAPARAGTLAMYTVAAAAVFSALVIRAGLRGGRPATSIAAPPLRQVLGDGLASARNRRIALCYLAAFVARSDMTTVGLYFSLWITTTGVEQGLSTAEAMAKSTLFFGAMNVASLLWAPVMGAIIDRVERVTALAIAVALAAAGYGGVCLIGDPIHDALFWPAVVLLGIGVISPVLAAQALLGHETPAELRGAVNGMFSASGSVGILLISIAGGYLFDLWKQSPFLVVSALNALLLVAAWAVRRAQGASVAHAAGLGNG